MADMWVLFYSQESTHVEVPRFSNTPTDLSPNLLDRLNSVTDVLSRVSKLVSEDLDKAVCSAVVQDNDGNFGLNTFFLLQDSSLTVFSVAPGSPQDKRPVLAVVPSPAAPCLPGGKEGLGACESCSVFFTGFKASATLQKVP